MTNCGKEKQTPENFLTYRVSYLLGIPEISGLSMYSGSNRFLAVSDSLSHVYLISALGEILDSLNFTGKNLEGITYDSEKAKIFVVEENSNEVVCIDTMGNESFRFKIMLNNLIVKHGLEGITCNQADEVLYIVSEKYPGRLYRYSEQGQIIDSTELSWAKDYSAVFYEPMSGKLWILSDESGILSRCDISGQPEETWLTGIKNGEGLVVDIENDRIMIVTDKESRLVIFDYPQN